MLGIELLDERTPTEILASIADADVVVVADGHREQWAEAVCAYAAAVGVPIVAPANGLAALAIGAGKVSGATFAPGNAQDLVDQITRLATGNRLQHRRSGHQSVDDRRMADTHRALLDRLLAAAGYERTTRASHAGPLNTLDESLNTEIAHAAAH